MPRKMYLPVLLQLGDLILQRCDLLVLRERKDRVRRDNSLREIKCTSSELAMDRREQPKFSRVNGRARASAQALQNNEDR